MNTIELNNGIKMPMLGYGVFWLARKNVSTACRKPSGLAIA